MVACRGFIGACIIAAGCSGGQSTHTSDAVERVEPEDLVLQCQDGVVLTVGEYRVENNTWGKGDLTGWTQCVGLGDAADGGVSARWTWDWPDSGGSVKAYPEIIFGRKPSSTTTTASLPAVINALQQVSVRYDLEIVHMGSGNTAFDLWLTDTPDPTSFSVPPITHEIMIWLERYGSMLPGGTLRERTTIGGTRYDVYVGDNFGGGWRYIAFSRVDLPAAADTLEVLPLLAYARDAGLLTGGEYLSSIEFGNEVVSGVGDTRIRSYAVSVR